MPKSLLLILALSLSYSSFTWGARPKSPSVDYSCETFLAKIPIEKRQVVARTSYLPYFGTSFQLVEIMNTGGAIQYAIVSTGGDTFGFSSAELFDFWLNEILFEKELNHALKMDRMRYGGGNLMRRILRISVKTQFITQKNAEQVLVRFMDRLEGLNLLSWNWKQEIKEDQLLKFIKTFPNTNGFYNSELIARWDEKFSRYYSSLKPAQRILFTRHFFNPAVPLTQDEALIQKYLFQGNTEEQARVFDQIRETIASWFEEQAPHLKGYVFNGSTSRQVYYSVSTALGEGATLPDGRSIIESGTVDLDPVTRLEQLAVSEHTIERLKAHGFYEPVTLHFFEAEKLVEILSLSREDFIELADVLFEEGIILKINEFWDYRTWRILKDRTYLRMPKRQSPKDGVDRSPVPRRLYGEFE